MTVMLDDWGLERPLVVPMFYTGMWAQPRYAFLPLDMATYLEAEAPAPRAHEQSAG